MTGTAIICQGDARCLPLLDDSVSLIITSPPYFGLRDYDTDAPPIGAEDHPKAYLGALIEATAEMARVLRPDGTIWVNLGDRYTNRAGGKGWGGSKVFGGLGDRADQTIRRRVAATRPDTRFGWPEKTLMMLPARYAIRCVDELGLILRSELIWSKPNGVPESVTDRVRRSHEVWYCFAKSPRYYCNIDAIRTLYNPASVACAGRARDTAYAAPGQTANKRCESPINLSGALPPSVWHYSTQPVRLPGYLKVEHPAPFPTKIVRRIVLGWSRPDDLVLDPFGGIGTTALVAKTLGRVGVSVDLSADYTRAAAWRVNDPRSLRNATRA